MRKLSAAFILSLALLLPAYTRAATDMLAVPEMAALMGALGCRRAVSLDGGISGQLAVREPGGALRKWTAWRMVPLGLLVLDRPAASAGH